MAEERVMFRTAVFIVVRNDEGQILLQQRAGTDYMPGYYDVPSGHIEANESFAAAAVRELAEETCLQVNESNLELLSVSRNDLDYPYINIMFEAKRWSGEPTIGEPHKCTAMQFFAVDNLPEKCTLAVRLLEQQDFRFSPKMPYVTQASYVTIMGEAFSLAEQ